MSWLEKARAKAHDAMTKLPGKAGELARRANDALGRPLADETELADRRAFESRATATATTPVAAPAAPKTAREPAPVVVYHMDKTRRDAQKLTEILDSMGIPYKVMNIQEDPAAQMSVRRDSGPYRLPVVFIAGEAIGGRTELTVLMASGDLKKKVFGS